MTYYICYYILFNNNAKIRLKANAKNIISKNLILLKIFILLTFIVGIKLFTKYELSFNPFNFFIKGINN